MVEKIDKVGHNDACLEFPILVKETEVVGCKFEVNFNSTAILLS